MISFPKNRIKTVVRSRSFLLLVYFCVRAYSRLLRIRVENEQSWTHDVEKGGGVLLAIFHQQFFPLIRHFKTYERFDPIIMISRSSDGDIIAPVAQRTGWRVARGSSSRGGRKAMGEMVDSLARGGLGANIVDGPRGPMGRVKPGTVRIAQRSGAVIVPCVVMAESAWYVNSWDRFMIPKPFSRVVIRFKEKIPADDIKTDRAFEEAMARLETVMAPYLVNP
ncbi:MAG: lysophospholipid acyltransferase family protein [Desulfobacteraceae bacterium]